MFAVALLGLVGAFSGLAQAAELGHLFQPYQSLLEHHLVERELPDGGLVSAFDYLGALASKETGHMLKAQRIALAGFETSELETRGMALAFWINAYNFFMTDYILRNPDKGEPPGSVRDYGSLFNPYRLFERRIFDIGGQSYSLQEIELDVLLGTAFAERGWKDARVHFMVNCASVGCPALRGRVYTAENIDAMLSENTRRALDTPLHLRRDGNVLRLTSLFDWYRADFAEYSGSVRDFIREHGGANAQALLEGSGKLKFIDYDWSLNSPENFEPILREAGLAGFE